MVIKQGEQPFTVVKQEEDYRPRKSDTLEDKLSNLEKLCKDLLIVSCLGFNVNRVVDRIDHPEKSHIKTESKWNYCGNIYKEKIIETKIIDENFRTEFIQKWDEKSAKGLVSFYDKSEIPIHYIAGLLIYKEIDAFKKNYKGYLNIEKEDIESLKLEFQKSYSSYLKYSDSKKRIDAVEELDVLQDRFWWEEDDKNFITKSLKEAYDNDLNEEVITKSGKALGYSSLRIWARKFFS